MMPTHLTKNINEPSGGSSCRAKPFEGFLYYDLRRNFKTSILAKEALTNI